MDLLANGSYFVAPPSSVEGNVYEWIEQSEAVLCPDWVANLGTARPQMGHITSLSRVPEIIRELFPTGKESGENGEFWMGLCPYHDDKEESLSITLGTGDFRCFACPARGTLFQLYAKLKGVSEEQAIDLLFPAPDYILRLNQRHAVVSLGGTEVILNEEYDWQGNYAGVSFSSPSCLTLKYENERVRVDKKEFSIAEAWRRHPRRRQYDRVIFEPGIPQESRSFNLWKGFSVKPDPDRGKCELYLSHLFENICRKNGRYYEYLISWMADAVQKPRNKPGVAIVLHGRQGTGKSVASEEFGKLFGIHFVTLASQKHLLGNFNAHLKQALVVLAEEAFWAGDKSAEGIIKDLITGSKIRIEPKGKDVFSVPNYIRLLICSNNRWVIPAGPEERRFFVLEVGNDKKQNHDYFDEITKQMEEGGRGALLHFLQNYQIKINLRRVPTTELLQENKLRSMCTVEQFIYEALDVGRLCSHHEEWRQSVACREVHFAYREYACRMGHTRAPRTMQTELGKALHRLLGDVRKRQEMTSNGRINVWDFPNLIECRKHFDEVMNWPDHEWSLAESGPVEEFSSEDFPKIWPNG